MSETIVNLTISADQNGNPTAPPGGGAFEFGGNFGSFAGFSIGGFGFFGIAHGRRGWF
jgi:hypothetical protein